MQKIHRKGWRVDLKWLCSILAAIFLTVSLTSLALYRAADSPELSKLQKESVIQSLAKSPGGQVGDFKIIGKSPTDVKIKIGQKEYSPDQLSSMPEADFKQLMQDFDGGKMLQNFSGMIPQSQGKNQVPDVGALGKTLSDPNAISDAVGSMVPQMLMPMAGNFLNDAAKSMFMTMFILNLLGAILFLALVVAFSYRAGRLTSFSLILLLAALPVFTISLFLKMSGSITGAISNTDPLSLFSILGNANFSLFLTLVIIAGVLLFVSLLLSAILAMTSKNPSVVPQAQQSQTPQPLPKAS